MTGPLAWALDGVDRMRLALRLSLRGFTDHAVNALLAARAEAARRSHRELTAGHVLLGIATIRACVGKLALDRLGVDLGRDAEAIAALVGTPEAGRSGGRPLLDSGAKALIERARAEARRSGLGCVGTEHLIFALLSEDGPAADYLRGRGITPQRLTVELRSLGLCGATG
jgi:ATP-dependent Clp protease ATP-binding subunit ClpA